MFEFITILTDKSSLLLGRRFGPAAFAAASAPVLQAIPVTASEWWVTGALVCSMALAIEAAYGLPHERRRLFRARKLLQQLDFDGARKAVKHWTGLSSAAYRIKCALFLAELYRQEQDLVTAWQQLERIEQRSLLPSEKDRYQELLATLYHLSGNHRELRHLADGKLERDVLTTSGAILVSHAREVEGNRVAAKAILERALISANGASERIALYNNLGWLEALSGNEQERIDFLLRAAEELRKQPLPGYFESVYHNLAISLVRAGRKDEAIELLDEYGLAIDQSNMTQLFGYANDFLHVARELGDKARIQEAHARLNVIPTSALTPEQQLAYRVSELRMVRNDNISLANYTTTVEALVKDLEETPESERVRALVEIVQDIESELKVAAVGQHTTMQAHKLQTLYQTVAEQLLTLNTAIDAELIRIPADLPGVRQEWMKYRHALSKIAIAQYFMENNVDQQTSNSLFDRLFSNLEERARLGRDKANTRMELDALLTLCDEFAAYRAHLGEPFHRRFYPRALESYQHAAKLLTEKANDPIYHPELIAMAWYAFKLGKQHETAMGWIEAANRLGIPLAHYAHWLRSMHGEVSAWVEQCERARGAE